MMLTPLIMAQVIFRRRHNPNTRLTAAGIIGVYGLDEMLQRNEIVVKALLMREVDSSGRVLEYHNCILAPGPGGVQFSGSKFGCQKQCAEPSSSWTLDSPPRSKSGDLSRMPP